MADIDYDRFAEALIRAQRKAGGGGGGGGGPTTDAARSELGRFAGALGAAIPPAYEIKDSFKKVVDGVGASLDTWRELSKTGVNFGNDMLAMQTAAKGARMELGDFNEIVSQNRASLAGWSGGIDKGAKDFARVSKEMFDSYAATTDSLRHLGYTNKDLNEILALQMASIGTSMRDGKAKDEAAIKAATDLANEMDLMAKMTGKSREEQMEAQKKLQMDQAYQAKIALETQNMSEEEALEYTKKMKEEYAKAEAAGLGQVFKEQFLYGTVATKEAAMQLAASGKAGLATVEQASAAASGNFKLASEKAKEAQTEAAKMSKDTGALQMRVISGLTGDFGAATVKFARETEALSKGIEGLRKKIEQETGKPVTTEQAADAYREQAKKDQKNVPASTAAAVNLEQRGKDAASAFQSGFVDPIIKQTYPALQKFNEGVLSAEGGLKKLINAGEPAAKKVVNEVGDKANKAVFGVEPSKDAAKKSAESKAIERKAAGGPVKEGEPYIVGDGGEEELFVPKTAGDLIPKSKLTSKIPSIDVKGITGGTGDAVKNMPKADAVKMPGIDINKILTDIKTTVSKVEVSNWPKEITELKKLTPVQTQPAPAPKAAEPKKEEPKKEEPKKEEPKKEEPKKEEPKKEEPKKEQPKVEPKKEEVKDKAATAPVTAPIAAPVEKPAEVKNPNSSESYKINGKEVDKKEFDKHMEANPQLASLMNMKGLMPSAGGADQAAGSSGGNAAAALNSVKELQAQVSKVNEDDWVFKKKTAEDLTSRQKEMLKEMSGLTLEEAKAQLQAKRDKNHAAMEELADITTRTDAIKYQALTQNRALTDKEKAEIDAIEKPLKEKQARESEANAKSADEYAALQMLIEQKQDVEKKAASEQVAVQKASTKDMLQETRQAIDGQLVITRNGHTQTYALSEREKAMKEQLSSMTLEELQAKSKANKANLEKALEETELIKANGFKIMDMHNKKNIVGTEVAEKELKEHNKTLNEKFASNKQFYQEDKVLELLMLEKSADQKKSVAEEQLAVEKAAGKDAVQQTREAIDEELMIKQKAIEETEALTKKSEELQKQGEAIGERMLDRQNQVAKLQQIASERELTDKEKLQLKYAESGLIRAQNNFQRNLDEQNKVNEALWKIQQEADDRKFKSAEQQARDKMELAAINNDEELEAAQIDTAAQSKFSYVDKDKIGEDIDSIVPTSAGATDAEMKAVEAQDNIDKAIERQKEAQQKLNDLLMGASEEDIGEQYEYYAKQLDEANQNLAKVVDESFGDLVGTVEDSGTDFSDSLTQVSEDINEFSGVDESIGGQMLENMDLGPKYSEQVSEDIDSSVPSMGATDAEMKAIAAQDKIDEAIARQKEAQEKLASLSVDDEDFLDKYEMAAQQLKEANEDLAKVVDESFGDLVGGLKDSGDDFTDNTEKIMDDIRDAIPGPTDEDMQSIAAMDEQDKELESQQAEQANLDRMAEDIGGDMLANMNTGPKYSEQAAAEPPKDTLDRSKIKFGTVSKIDPKTGLPILAEPKKDDKNLPKVENPDDARENAKFKRQAEENKKAEAKKAEDEKNKEGGKSGESKSLDDVVKTLEKLNTAMEKLIAVNNTNTSLLRDQIKATKTSGTKNLYEAH